MLAQIVLLHLQKVSFFDYKDAFFVTSSVALWILVPSLHQSKDKQRNEEKYQIKLVINFGSRF